MTSAALQSAKSADLIVAISDPTRLQPEAQGDLLIYHAQAKGGYALAQKMAGEGVVALLRAGDINADGKAEVVWSDTVCGAHTCASTLHVDAWDGKAYQAMDHRCSPAALGRFRLQGCHAGRQR